MALNILSSSSDSDSESGEEEFTPSVWQQDKEPGQGLLRSPERKSVRSVGDDRVEGI